LSGERLREAALERLVASEERGRIGARLGGRLVLPAARRCAGERDDDRKEPGRAHRVA
jgi:hypothetical protein